VFGHRRYADETAQRDSAPLIEHRSLVAAYVVLLGEAFSEIGSDRGENEADEDET
jgi:hypothetical protein